MDLCLGEVLGEPLLSGMVCMISPNEPSLTIKSFC